jgi:hypothetical protein
VKLTFGLDHADVVVVEEGHGARRTRLLEGRQHTGQVRGTIHTASLPEQQAMVEGRCVLLQAVRGFVDAKQ